jgi:hypothetical protein
LVLFWGAPSPRPPTCLSGVEFVICFTFGVSGVEFVICLHLWYIRRRIRHCWTCIVILSNESHIQGSSPWGALKDYVLKNYSKRWGSGPWGALKNYSKKWGFSPWGAVKNFPKTTCSNNVIATNTNTDKPNAKTIN